MKKEKFEECMELTEDTVKEVIKSNLIKLKYNFNYIGTDYLIETIYYLYCSKLYYKFCLETDVYPIIANRYGTVVNTIKSNIINATDKMFYDCDEKVLKRYLGKCTLTKPGPKKIIKAILLNIKDLQ